MSRSITSKVLLALALLLPSVSWGAVAIGTSASNAGTIGGTTLTIVGFTVTAGTDLVVVQVGAGSATQANRTVSSVSWNGNAMTHVGSATADDGNFLASDVYYLLSPTAGTGNVVVTMGGTGGIIFASVSNFSGANQSTPFGTPVTGSSTANNSPTVSVTYSAGDILIGVVASDANATITETGTLIAEAQALSSDVCAGSQYFTGGGTQSVSWTASTPDNGWAVTGVAVKAAGAGGGGSPSRLPLLGVGP